MENTLTAELRELLLQNGADMVGVGDLTPLPAGQRCGMPLGVCVAVKFPKEVIRGIGELPTPAYKQWYDDLNDRLDALVTQGAELLKSRGYQAQGQTRAQVGRTDQECLTRLPYKTVATRAGLGWIGKSALLVTEEYGSMVRLASILTDAPLTRRSRSSAPGAAAVRPAGTPVPPALSGGPPGPLSWSGMSCSTIKDAEKRLWTAPKRGLASAPPYVENVSRCAHTQGGILKTESRSGSLLLPRRKRPGERNVSYKEEFLCIITAWSPTTCTG